MSNMNSSSGGSGIISCCNESNVINQGTAENAGKVTGRIIESLLSDSNLFTRETLDQVPKMNPNEIQIGRLLGRGGFNFVRQVAPYSNEHEYDEYDEYEWQQQQQKQKYVIKYLNFEKVKRGKRYARGSADLAIEAYFLASIRHDNIIQMFGMTEGSIVANVAKGTEECFFLVLEQIKYTLRTKLHEWQYEEKKNKKGYFLSRNGRNQRSVRFQTRLQTIQQLTSAIAYLHSKSIVYRDIKPDNIGFDANGVLKLFDFGLAKELKHRDLHPEDGTYKLTGSTGSCRYMAPEVALFQRYNLSADIFSLAIISWEILSLQKPFESYDNLQYKKYVVRDGLRPKIEKKGKHSHWPKELQSMLTTSWDKDFTQRPTCPDIQKTITNVITTVTRSTNNTTTAGTTNIRFSRYRRILSAPVDQA